MFAGLLNKGLRGSLVLLISFFAVMAVLTRLSPYTIENITYPNLFFNYLANTVSSETLILLINCLFVAISAALLNMLCVKEEVSDKQNYHPVFLYLVIAFSTVNANQLQPMLSANLFLFFAFYRIMGTYRSEHANNRIFEGAFWLALSAYFTISSVTWIPVYFVALTVLRPFVWREWVIACLGFLSPIVMSDALAYLSDFNNGYLWEAAGFYFTHMKVPALSEYYLFEIILLTVLFIFALLQNMAFGLGNTVKKQRAKTLLIWLLVFSLPQIFEPGANSSTILLSFAMPVSIFTGDLLFGIRQKKITNTLLVLILLAAAIVVCGKFGLL